MLHDSFWLRNMYHKTTGKVYKEITLLAKLTQGISRVVFDLKGVQIK